jgi:alpha-beta hydrolase superfamily lysophospholipase
MSKLFLRRVLVVLSGLLATLYAAFATAIYFGQDSMIFQGVKLPDDYRFQVEVPYEELAVTVDGASLSAIRITQDHPRGLIFFLHGNGGNLDSWTSGADYYRSVNYDMFMLDYRGYGKSTGEILSEAQLHSDIRAAWDFITPDYAGKPIVIYGRSLGAALAAELAAHVDAERVILVSPFSSMVAIAKENYPLLPAQLVRYPFRTDKEIARIRAPIVLVHGDRDELISVSHSETLLRLAHAPKKLLLIEGAGHGDIHQFAAYVDGLTAELP